MAEKEFALDLSGIEGLAPDVQRRLQHEAEHALALFSVINTKLAERRAGPEALQHAIAAVQCAVARYYYTMIPTDNYGTLQPLFDKTLQQLMLVGSEG